MKALAALLLLATSLHANTFREAHVAFESQRYRPNSVAIADFNGDGLADVAANGWCYPGDPCPLMLFYQTKNGTLAEPVFIGADAAGSDIQAGDFNNDGRMDIVLAGAEVQVLLQTADGTLDAPASYETPSGIYDLGVGDVTGDGRTDIVGMPWGGDEMYVLEQQPVGTGLVPRTYPMTGYGYDDFDLIDLNGDGRRDAIDASAQGAIGVMHVCYATSTGFDAPLELRLPWHDLAEDVEGGDFNGDGRMDLAVIAHGTFSDMPPYVGLMLRTASGSFEAGPLLQADYWPETLLVADFDRDGDSDIAVGGGAGLQVWIQTRPGVFEQQRYVLPRHSNFSTHDHLAAGDVNHDGATDLVVALDNGALAVLYGILPRRHSVAR